MLKKQTAGLTNSWAIRWYASAFLKNKLTLYPGKSLVQNIGQDMSGTHEGNSAVYQTAMADKKISIGSIEIMENRKAREAIADHFKSINPGIFGRVIKRYLNDKNHIKKHYSANFSEDYKKETEIWIFWRLFVVAGSFKADWQLRLRKNF